MKANLLSVSSALGMAEKSLQTPFAKTAGQSSVFQEYLQKSGVSEKDTSKKVTSKKDASPVDSTGKEVDKKEAIAQPKEKKAVTTEAKKSREKETAQTENTKENNTGHTEKTENEVVTGENQVEARKLKEWMQKIQKILGITAEEMMTQLNALGMVSADLLDAGKLQNFYMQVKGIDVSQLLTEQKTASELKHLLAETTRLKEELAVTSASQNETFHALVEKALTELTASEQKEQTAPTVQTSEEASAGSKAEVSEKPSGEVAERKENPVTEKMMPQSFQAVVETKEQIMVTANGLEKVTQVVTVKDIFEQIVTKFTAENLGDASKVTIQLNPEHLGKIAFQVVSRQGQMTGQFVAENEAVKSAIEAQMSQLKTHLAEQGLQVQDVKVVVGDTVNYFAGDQSRQQEENYAKQSKKSKKVYVEAVAEETQEAVETVKSPTTVSTASVEFTA